MVPTLPHALASRLPARLRTLVGAGPRGGVVLELELGRGLVEAPPTSPLEAVRSLNRPSLRTVVEALEKACDDEEVVGLVAHVCAWEPTLAQSAELREAVGRLREAGTRTVVWSEAYGELGPGNTPYHLASAFEEVWLQPSGDVGLVGMAGRATFLRGALDKLGVRAPDRAAPRVQVGRGHLPALRDDRPVREMLTRLVTSATDTLVADVAQGRGLTREAVRAPWRPARSPPTRRWSAGWWTGSATATRSTTTSASARATRTARTRRRCASSRSTPAPAAWAAS